MVWCGVDHGTRCSPQFHGSERAGRSLPAHRTRHLQDGKGQPLHEPSAAGAADAAAERMQKGVRRTACSKHFAAMRHKIADGDFRKI